MRKGARAVGTIVSKTTTEYSETGKVETLSADVAIAGRIAGACAFCSTSSCMQHDESQVKSMQAKEGLMAATSSTAIKKSANLISTIVEDRRFDDR